MPGYAVYVLLVCAGFGVWALLFWFMRTSSGPKRMALGWSLVGPFHAYLEKRGYRLRRRELFGWALVGAVMLLAPVLSWLLER